MYIPEKIQLVTKCLRQIAIIVKCEYENLSEMQAGQVGEHTVDIFNYGLSCFTKQKFEFLKESLEAIHSFALHGQAGTEPENGQNTADVFDPYEEIISEFALSSVNLIALDERLRFTMGNFAKMNQVQMNFFRENFAKINYVKKTKFGGTRKMSAAEVQAHDDNTVLSNLELSAQQISWTQDFTRIKEICESRGSFDEIIALL